MEENRNRREQPKFLKTISNAFTAVSNFGQAVGSCVYKLRKVLLTVPVLAGLGYLTTYNASHLSDSVGIGLAADGSYTVMVSKNLALMGPVAVTAFCLLMMYASRKPMQPWVVSVFSLVLPLLILLMNQFPA